MQFKCKLKVFLVERDIKLGDFAQKVGVSRNTLSNLVHKHHLPTFLTAYKIAKELDMKIEDIWILDEETQKSP